MSSRFQDNNSYSIEGSKKLYVQYSHSIDFDYSNNKYPTGEESDWDWEDVYIPIPHYYNGVLVAGHTFKRERLDKSGNWSLPIAMVGKSFNIDYSGSLSERPDASTLEDGTTFYDTETGLLYVVEGGEWNDGVQFKGDSGDLLTVGVTETLVAGSAATVSISGTSPNKVLNFGIPKGQDAEVLVEYSVDGLGGWVDTYVAGTHYYMRISSDNGLTWSNSIYIAAKELARETSASLVGQANFFYQVIDAENIIEVRSVNFDQVLVKNAGTGATIYTYVLTPPDATDGAGNTSKALTGLSDNLAAGFYDIEVSYTSGKSIGSLTIRSNKV